MFTADVADLLELDLTGGERIRFRTANSGFEAYGHEVELTALGLTTHSMVYFFADPEIRKNVLGRNGWLDRIRLGVVHQDCKIYVAPYDE